MWPTRFNTSAAPLHELLRSLNALRKAHRIGHTSGRLAHIDPSSAVMLRGSETDGLWLFVSAWPGSEVHMPRRYCAFGLERAALATSWVDALSGELAEFTRSG